MDHALTIRVPDDVFQELSREATAHGAPVEAFAEQAINRQFAPRKHPDGLSAEVAHQRLIAHFGSIKSDCALGLDNEQIDADLAQAYEHQGE